MDSTPNKVDFDNYSQEYRDLITNSVGLSGETDDYFDLYKVDCLKRWVIGGDAHFDILDFGCGIGKQTGLLASLFASASVVGFDVSEKSVQMAQEKFSDILNVRFCSDLPAGETYDLITMANVLHHIAPEEREEILVTLKNRLKPDGRLVIFEHNPLNPLTRHVVNTCPFDTDAVLVWPWAFSHVFKRVGFYKSQCRYIVFFPRFLSFLRRFEQHLWWLPIGAQYMLILRH